MKLLGLATRKGIQLPVMLEVSVASWLMQFRMESGAVLGSIAECCVAGQSVLVWLAYAVHSAGGQGAAWKWEWWLWCDQCCGSSLLTNGRPRLSWAQTASCWQSVASNLFFKQRSLVSCWDVSLHSNHAIVVVRQMHYTDVMCFVSDVCRNAGCNQLCLPSRQHLPTCLCADNSPIPYVLAEDGKTCHYFNVTGVYVII